jgi:glycosyltransferase 2 family protein
MARWRAAGWVRLVLSGALLGVIFHVIFCNEAQLRLAETGAEWSKLGVWERRGLAWRIGPQALWETSKNLKPGALAVALAACGLLVVLGGLRWRSVLKAQGFSPSIAESLRLAFIAQFFNAFLLGSAGGDVVRAWYSAQAAPGRRPEAAATVFVDRLVGTLALLIVAVVFAAVNNNLLLLYKRHLAVAMVVAAMMGVAGVVTIAAFYTGVFQPDSPTGRALVRFPKGASVIRALASCRALGRRPGFVASLAGWSAASNLCVIAAFAALASGLGIDKPLALWAYVAPAVVAVSAIPITPAGLGVRENLFVWLLTPPAIGVKPGAALSLSLLGYTANLAWSVVGGLVYLASPGVRKDQSPAA